MIILLSLLSTGASAHEVPYHLEGEIKVEYTVINSNNSTGFWSYYPSPGGENYNVESSSLINVSFTSFEDRQSNFSLSIGNITLSSTNETYVQDNLAFGYWSLPSTFGFRAKTEWSEIKSALSETDGLNSTVETTIIEYLGTTISTVNITIQDAYQESNIIYEEETGLLVYGYSNVFGFLLEIKISTINQNENYFADNIETTLDESPLPLSILIVGILAICILRYRKI